MGEVSSTSVSGIAGTATVGISDGVVGPDPVGESSPALGHEAQLLGIGAGQEVLGRLRPRPRTPGPIALVVSSI